MQLFRHADRWPPFRLCVTRPAFEYLGERRGNTFLEALVAVAASHREWVRPPEMFEPRTRAPSRLFAELLRHLFAEYDVPEVLDEVWFCGSGPDARIRRGWYLHVARGRSIRECNLPFPLTKRAAHAFASAPAAFSLDGAFRFCQAIAAGASESVAAAVAETCVSHTYGDNDYWRSVLEWVGRQPNMTSRQAFGVVQRLVQAKRVGREITVRGKSVDMVVKRTDEVLQRRELDGRQDWHPSGIAGFTERVGPTTWRIRELLSAADLEAEGRAMRHCVAGYAHRCGRGESSVWSMGVSHGQDERTAGRRSQEVRCLTIEVCPRNRSVVQVRGWTNRRMIAAEYRVVRRWAEAVGVDLPIDV